MSISVSCFTTSLHPNVLLKHSLLCHCCSPKPQHCPLHPPPPIPIPHTCSLVVSSSGTCGATSTSTSVMAWRVCSAPCTGLRSRRKWPRWSVCFWWCASAVACECAGVSQTVLPWSLASPGGNIDILVLGATSCLDQIVFTWPRSSVCFWFCASAVARECIGACCMGAWECIRAAAVPCAEAMPR